MVSARTKQHHVSPCLSDGMDKKPTARRTRRGQFEPEHSHAQKAENCAVLAPHMARIHGENTFMDSNRAALTISELAALYGGNPRSARNAFYLHPEDFPPALYLPGTRGPRFLVTDALLWLESRKTQPAPPPPATTKPRQGRPRKASAMQIARARKAQGGAA